MILKKNITQLIIVFAVLLTWFACSNRKLSEKPMGKEIDLWLNSHRPDMGGQYYLAQFSKEDLNQWDTLEFQLEGFKYIPGSLYHLKVRKEQSEAELDTYHVTDMIEQSIDRIQRIHDIYVLRDMPGFTGKMNKPSRAIIEINTNTRELLGQAHCNQINADIETLSESEITFGPISQTKMACPELLAESELVKRLSSTRAYMRKELSLEFLNDKDEVILTFKKVD